MTVAEIPFNLPPDRESNLEPCEDYMTGLVMIQPRIPSCVLPVAAAAGLSMASLAAIDWGVMTQRATAAIGLAGIVGGAVVGGIIYAIKKFDQVAIERRKFYDEHNKGSLSVQLEQLIAQHAEGNEKNLVNQEAMRASLHELRNEAQLSKAENHELRMELGTLRSQFMAVSKQLHETDLLLHAARAEMHNVTVELKHTSEALAASERERQSLRDQVAGLRSGQVGQGERLAKLEQSGSADNYPIPPGLLDPPAGGTPVIPKGDMP